MDKISGIIPSSPRVSSVDMKEAAPTRPGTPSFGRPEGVSSLAKSVGPQDTATRSAGIQSNMMDWRAKESRQAAVAQEVTDKFFAKNRQAAAPVIDIDEPKGRSFPSVSASSRPAGFKTEELGASKSFYKPSMIEEEDGEDAPRLQQPDGLFPKGSFIDRTA